MADFEKADAFLAEMGLHDVPRFFVTRGKPSPAMERRDDVIGGVRSLAEALDKVVKAPIPVAFKKAEPSVASVRARRRPAAKKKK